MAHGQIYLGSTCTNQARFSNAQCSHSCLSIFASSQDRDGQATIIALNPISKGEEVILWHNFSCCSSHTCNEMRSYTPFARFEEVLFNIIKHFQVTISYVDEDLPFDERQALLADYGFKCKCPRCSEEEAWRKTLPIFNPWKIHDPCTLCLLRTLGTTWSC